MFCSNLTNKYNPQEQHEAIASHEMCSNLTNKYNPQELDTYPVYLPLRSNLTNKYNPQELFAGWSSNRAVQILPINTILKNC